MHKSNIYCYVRLEHPHIYICTTVAGSIALETGEIALLLYCTSQQMRVNHSISSVESKLNVLLSDLNILFLHTPIINSYFLHIYLLKILI